MRFRPRFRPIYAVLERELLRMVRQRTRLVAAMVRPLIWLLVIGGGFAALLGPGYKSFLVPGVLGMTLLFGAIGYLMVAAGWPRAPFVLGLVLGKIAENNLYISMARYDWAWLTRPVVLVLIAIAVAVIVYPLFQTRRKAVARA